MPKSDTELLDFNVEADDTVLPFSVPGLDVRGRVVRLGEAVDEVISRHDYPEPVSRVLGEALALTALLGSSLKFKGRFVLQTQTDGPISFLVTDYTVPGKLRGYCRFDAERIAAEHITGEAALLGKGHLAFTIDQGPDMHQYQGIVPLEGTTLTDAAHAYFQQSEQIPTIIRLAAGEVLSGGTRHWRAGGLMVQHLPQTGGDPGEAEARLFGDADADHGDAGGADWDEASAFVATVEDHEMLDPGLTAEALLYRLFHERGVRVFSPLPLEVHCRCSRDRIVAMLDQFTDDEIRDMTEDGAIKVTCEFCNRIYDFDPVEFLKAAD